MSFYDRSGLLIGPTERELMSAIKRMMGGWRRPSNDCITHVWFVRVSPKGWLTHHYFWHFGLTQFVRVSQNWRYKLNAIWSIISQSKLIRRVLLNLIWLINNDTNKFWHIELELNNSQRTILSACWLLLNLNSKPKTTDSKIVHPELKILSSFTYQKVASPNWLP